MFCFITAYLLHRSSFEAFGLDLLISWHIHPANPSAAVILLLIAAAAAERGHDDTEVI